MADDQIPDEAGQPGGEAKRELLRLIDEMPEEKLVVVAEPLRKAQAGELDEDE